MPNRILKESICTSDSIDQLSWFEEVLFYRLIVSCDDYGRFDGRIVVIRNKLFPTKDTVTVKAVSEAIDKLASIGVVTLYKVHGKPYLCLPTWDCHQSVRAQKSKYPSPDEADPEEELKPSESNCMQMISDASKCPRNPIQSESESESNSGTTRRRVRENGQHDLSKKANGSEPDGFAEFWYQYPRKEGKAKAEAAWRRLKPSEATRADIMAALSRAKMTPQWSDDGGRYIPHASTWINGRRWEDEPVQACKPVSELDRMLAEAAENGEGSEFLNAFFNG